jgi:hypothetical protein
MNAARPRVVTLKGGIAIGQKRRPDGEVAIWNSPYWDKKNTIELSVVKLNFV